MFTTLQLDGRSFLRPVLLLLVLVCAALSFPARGDPPVPAAALPNYAATTPAPVSGMPLAIVYRYGGQWNEWFVRGDAAVSSSPSLVRGARLSAWDGDNPDDLSRVAVATAVYLIPLPPESRSLIIEVGYLPQDTARNKTVAGFLFVRDRAVERQYAAWDQGKTGPFDEPGFYGDTYLLPAGQVRATFDIPAADRLSDGILELHLSAGAGQVMDVQYIQVTAQAVPAPAPIAAADTAAPIAGSTLPDGAVAAPDTVVNPYDYSYTYYYAGPWYWPYNGYVVSFPLFCADFDWFVCGGWYPYRCCFWNHHDWCFRPDGVARERCDGNRDNRGHERFSLRGGAAIATTVNAYRADWFKRNFHVAAGASADVTGMARQHSSLLAPNKRSAFEQTTAAAMRETARISEGRPHDAAVSRSGESLIQRTMERPAPTPFQSHSEAVRATGSGMRPDNLFRAPRSSPAAAASGVAPSPMHWTIAPRSSEAMPRAALAASQRTWAPSSMPSVRAALAAPPARVEQPSFQSAPAPRAVPGQSFFSGSTGFSGRSSGGWSGSDARPSYPPAPSAAPAGWSTSGNASSWGSSGRSAGDGGWGRSGFTSGGRTGGHGWRG